MDGEDTKATVKAGFLARRSCPSCGGEHSRTLYDNGYTTPPVSDYLLEYGARTGEEMLRRLEGVRYTLLECASCGLVFQHEVPDDDTLGLLYEQWIEPEESLERSRGHELSRHPANAQELMQILSALGRRPASLRVLDFGMGWGSWLMMARAFGCQVWGSEISQARIAHTEALGIPNVEWEALPAHKFDVINTEQVFEHLVDPYGTLRHLGRALAPGGLLKISVPNGVGVRRRLRALDWKAPTFDWNSLNAVAPLEHINCFSAPSLRALGRRSGLEPVYLPLRCYYRFVFPWDGARQFAKQVVKPVYRSVLRRGTYMFFRRPLDG